jgi:hypothetical protein
MLFHPPFERVIYTFTINADLFCIQQARYTGFRDRPLHERQAKFQQACREGNIEMVR